MLDHEKQRLESIKSDYNQYWIPFSWASSRIINMRKRDKIASDMLMNGLYDVFIFFKGKIHDFDLFCLIGFNIPPKICGNAKHYKCTNMQKSSIEKISNKAISSK